MITWTEPVLIAYEQTFISQSSFSTSNATQTSNDFSTSFSFDTDIPFNPFLTITEESASFSDASFSQFATGISATTINESGTQVSWSSSSTFTESKSTSASAARTVSGQDNATAAATSSSSSTSNSGETTDSSSASASTQFVISRPLNLVRLTTTHTQQEVAAAITLASETQTTFPFLATTTLTASSGSTSTAETIGSEITTTTVSYDYITTSMVSGTAVEVEEVPGYLFNAANTIYLAEPYEVLAVAEHKQLSQWGEDLSVANYTTCLQTTISASTELSSLPIVDLSASTLSYVNSAFNSQVSWEPSSFTTTNTTLLGNFVGQSDNTSNAVVTTIILTTASWQTNIESQELSGIYSTVAKTELLPVVKTISKWRSISFQSTRAARVTYTYAISTTAQTTFSSQNENGGTTYLAGGQQLAVQTGALGVQVGVFSPNNSPRRIVYGSEGFSIEEQAGGRPVFNNNLAPAYVRWARRARSARGFLVPLPETQSQFSYTCDGAAYTLGYKSDNESVTTSALISVDGSAPIGVLHSGRTFGGSFLQGETAVHSANVGVYSNIDGETKSMADDTIFTNSVATSYFQPVPHFSGAVSPNTPVFILPRNYTELPPNVYGS